MVVATRQTGTSENTVNEELREMIGKMINASMRGMQESISQLNQSIQNLATAQEGFLVQQNYHTADINSLKNGEGTSRPMHYTRMTKLEFPKFSGDGVKGWIFRCQQFFKVDEVAEDQKVRLVSIHLFDKVLVWHRQFVKIHGETVEWSLYESEILKRFGACYEDPMEELKNLKQDGSVANYQDQFEVLLGNVELSDQYAISLMQEASKAALAKRSIPILNTPKTQFSKPSYPKSQTILPLPATKVVTTNTETPRRQLSRKEYEGKKAKNLCFYCDQKYTPGHKCTGQVFSIELLTEEECLGEESDSDQDIVYNVEEDRIQPHISLNALVDVMVLPLGGCEMVLGVQWLSTLGDIKWNFESMRMEFVYNGSKNVSLMTTAIEEHVGAFGTELTHLLDYFHDVFAIPTNLPPHRNRITELSYRKALNQLIQLNKHTVKDKFLIPVIEELIDELHGSTIFSKLDLMSGYHQIRMADEDVYKTAFRTHVGHYEFLVMPFVYSDSKQAHLQHLATVLQEMRKHSLFAKRSKCVFGVAQVEYLGHVISVGGVATDPSKIQAMKDWPKNSFGWNAQAEEAFQVLKQAMIEAPVLALPDFTTELTIETDASGTGLGAVLQQGGHLIAYLSKSSAPRHWSLSTYEKELMAVVLALDKISYYVLSKIDTDLMTKIQASWDKDVDLQQLIQKLSTKPDTSMKYTWKDAELRRKGKLVVGSDVALRTHLLAVFHCEPVGGHSGVNNPNLEAYPGALQPLPIPTRVWQDVSMDFVDGLLTSQGKTVILVIVDRLTKYAHFMDLSHPYTAVQVAQLFLDHVYKLHGMPKTIVSDKDKVFLSLFWKSLFKSLKTELHMSTTYHPQSDGQTEVVNRCLECFLRCMTGDKPKEWTSGYLWQNIGSSSVDLVDRTLVAREEAIELEKGSRQNEDDLQVAVPDHVKVHPVFHISQLKKCRSEAVNMGTFPVCNDNGLLAVEPQAMLDRRM
ncbi:retrotransposon-related protein [Tanacetum coccineum]